MSFIFNEKYNTVYATSIISLIDGLNEMFDLGIDIKKSYFGSMFNVHLAFKGSSVPEMYFYNRDDLLQWIVSTVKTVGSIHENYIGRYDAKLHLDPEFVASNKVVAVANEPEDLPVEEVGFEEVPECFADEIVFEEQSESVEEAAEPEPEDSVDLEEPNWKAMNGPKWSKQAIAEEAAKFNIFLNVGDKKQDMLSEFQKQFKTT